MTLIRFLYDDCLNERSEIHLVIFTKEFFTHS